MKKIQAITGKPIPLAMDDVDTDLIIPAQYLTCSDRKGYGKMFFVACVIVTVNLFLIKKNLLRQLF